jgi:hypothetical protein
MKYGIILFLGIVSNRTSAQVFKSLGLKPGINFTQFEWELREESRFPVEYFETKRTIGYNFFVTADVIMKKQWGVNSSLGFVQKNGTHIFLDWVQGNAYRSSTKYTLDYVSLINVARIKVPLSSTFKLTASAGPRLEYMVDPSEHLERYTPVGFSYHITREDINRLNVGLSTGIGVLLKLNKLTLGVDAWRNFNLNTIVSAKGPRLDGLGDEGFYLKMKDKTYMLNLLCIFDL